MIDVQINKNHYRDGFFYFGMQLTPGQPFRQAATSAVDCQQLFRIINYKKMINRVCDADKNKWRLQ